ncbi:dipeptide ABC transporter ATP-binding protein [Embleya sp. NPDC059237]|uniref:ABC transporter ATP-binding protein n=1 Tax=Embleya sp. NPDC059237 TaxID=3346784 RepID=UPI0036BC5965
MATDRGEPLLSVRDLRVFFPNGRRGRVDAVRGVDFDLRAGEVLAIVGESGSGKSVTARSLVGLAGPGAHVRADRLRVDGEDLRTASAQRLRRIRGLRVGLVLQDALSALDPVRTVGAEVGETLRVHNLVRRAEAVPRVVELLERARVPEPALRARQYPHQLSGGLRQRALIAAAMAADPPILIADEPTTALDVGVQARILDLLAAKRDAGTGILLISHDLAVVARLADRVAVMYDGVFVEEGPTRELLTDPRHPYTRHLLAAIPAGQDRDIRLSAGQHRADVAAPVARGCHYAPRCPLAEDACRVEEPVPVAIGDTHTARCRLLDAPWTPADRVSRAEGRPAGKTVLAAAHLSKSFPGPDRSRRLAVDDVSFTLGAGETLGIVGESGSGKSTTAQLVLGLLEPDEGQVTLHGSPWSHRRERDRRPLRRRIQFVPQEPLASFDPRYSVARLIAEGLGGTARREVRRHRARIAELLTLVGLDPALADARPRRLSGGQRQRVAIARALASEPDVIVCDEPVSALDVSVQAQILDLLGDLRQELGVALLFISHDLGVIRHLSDRVLVMHDGKVVETGTAREVFDRPTHEYTRSLLAALPRVGDAFARAEPLADSAT